MSLAPKYKSVDKLVADIKKDREIKKKIFIERADKIVNKARTDGVAKSLVEYGAFQREEISNMFKSSVEAFYSSYTPEYYTRRTRGMSHVSMDDVLSMKEDKDGTIILDGPEYMSLYDRSKMGKTRKGGDTLFDTVFVEGWHGGAKGSPSDPEKPHYRAPGFDKKLKVHHRFGRWGKLAFQSESVQEAMSRELSLAESGAFYQQLETIAKENDKVACDSVVPELNVLYKEIFK